MIYSHHLNYFPGKNGRTNQKSNTILQTTPTLNRSITAGKDLAAKKIKRPPTKETLRKRSRKSRRNWMHLSSSSTMNTKPYRRTNNNAITRKERSLHTHVSSTRRKKAVFRLTIPASCSCPWPVPMLRAASGSETRNLVCWSFNRRTSDPPALQHPQGVTAAGNLIWLPTTPEVTTRRAGFGVPHPLPGGTILISVALRPPIARQIHLFKRR